jgi:hypothetical protein
MSGESTSCPLHMARQLQVDAESVIIWGEMGPELGLHCRRFWFLSHLR